MAYNKQYPSQNGDVVEYLKDREDRIEAEFNELGVDYVVDFGNDYEKYNSGKMVQRGSVRFIGDISIPLANGYYAPVNSEEFTIPFVGKPTMIFSNEDVDGTVIVGINKVSPTTATETGDFLITSFTSAMGIVVDIMYEAKGRWK